MHFDSNIVFIIVAAVIGISRLVARIAENARDQSQRRQRETKPEPAQRQRPTPHVTVTGQKSDEERVREFLEALGVPEGAMPPPKVRPRTNVPPRPLAPISPPPMSRPFSPVLLKPVAEKVRKLFTPTAAPVAAPGVAPESDAPGAWLREEERIESAAGKFEAATRASAAQAIGAQVAPVTNWREALRSPQSVRAALVLREILGPPRAYDFLESSRV
jgi:hypothetical protein